MGGKRFIPGPSNNNSGIPESDSRDSDTETGSLEIELRVHTIHGKLETRTTDDASQLGGPHKGGRWIPTLGVRSC